MFQYPFVPIGRNLTYYDAKHHALSEKDLCLALQNRGSCTKSLHLAVSEISRWYLNLSAEAGNKFGVLTSWRKYSEKMAPMVTTKYYLTKSRYSLFLSTYSSISWQYTESAWNTAFLIPVSPQLFYKKDVSRYFQI